MKLRLLLVLVVALDGAADKARDEAKKDLDQLQGEWQLVWAAASPAVYNVARPAELARLAGLWLARLRLETA
jgi:hypothetical protein